MDGVLPAQPLKISPVLVFMEQLWIHNVNLFEVDRIGIRDFGVLLGLAHCSLNLSRRHDCSALGPMKLRVARRRASYQAILLKYQRTNDMEKIVLYHNPG